MSFTKEARKLKNEYAREWRIKNPEKIKKYQEKYWNQRAEKEHQKINNLL